MDEDEWTNMCAILCSRQNGKSWTVAVVLGSIMLACDAISIGCYATTSKQAAVIQKYVILIFGALGHRMNQRMSDNLCWFEHSAVAIATITSFGLNAYVNSHANNNNVTALLKDYMGKGMGREEDESCMVLYIVRVQNGGWYLCDIGAVQ